jgi:hypothetical protein
MVATKSSCTARLSASNMHNSRKFPAAVRRAWFSTEFSRFSRRVLGAHLNSANFVQKKTLDGAAVHQRKALIFLRFKCVVSTHFGNCVLLTLLLLLWFYR